MVGSPQRAQRAVSLLEIRLNKIRRERSWKPGEVISHDQFVQLSRDRWPDLHGRLITPELRQTVEAVRLTFCEKTAHVRLPYPAWFNSDISFAELTLAITLAIRPHTTVEVGVGYGVTTSLLLKGMEGEPDARLVSLDLPPLADSHGEWTGVAVEPGARSRWTLIRGASRSLLPAVALPLKAIDLFVSDSANVASLQRYELRQVAHLLSGAAIFNNVSPSFVDMARALNNFELFLVQQVEKTGDVTAILRCSGAL